MIDEELKQLAEARRLGVTGEGKRRREEANVSVPELARPLNIHPATLRRWEAGTVLPRREGGLRWLATLELLDGKR